MGAALKLGAVEPEAVGLGVAGLTALGSDLLGWMVVPEVAAVAAAGSALPVALAVPESGVAPGTVAVGETGAVAAGTSLGA
ncbi:hypothetical protein EHF33_08125 [Deinococcus psychrotolerans]|uniref:Uncharacterized protein n=1 Tax=Deinococcus psychrotolerans TaxID=2489213 RepID=A0A3G8YCT0_9DEIO|nr:hypothetical protein EHF33_08125 [Deinococcus psychrotolerans]